MSQPTEANFAIRDQLGHARLANRLTGDAERTFALLIPTHRDALAKRKLAAKTLRGREQKMGTLDARFGNTLTNL